MIGGVPHAGKQIIPRDYPEMIQVFLEAQIMIKNRDSCIAPFKFISFESKEKPKNDEFESAPGEMRVDATFYLVMGYADGGDLGRYLYSETGVRIRAPLLFPPVCDDVLVSPLAPICKLRGDVPAGKSSPS